MSSGVRAPKVAGTVQLSYRRFADVLRDFRERWSREMPVLSDAAASGTKTWGSVKRLCRLLAERGCPMSVTEYTDIEAGISLPRDCSLFLETVAECLDLSDERVEVLTLLLARDVLRNALGEEVMDAILGANPQIGDIDWA